MFVGFVAEVSWNGTSEFLHLESFLLLNTRLLKYTMLKGTKLGKGLGLRLKTRRSRIIRSGSERVSMGKLGRTKNQRIVDNIEQNYCRKQTRLPYFTCPSSNRFRKPTAFYERGFDIQHSFLKLLIPLESVQMNQFVDIYSLVPEEAPTTPPSSELQLHGSNVRLQSHSTSLRLLNIKLQVNLGIECEHDIQLEVVVAGRWSFVWPKRELGVWIRLQLGELRIVNLSRSCRIFLIVVVQTGPIPWHLLEKRVQAGQGLSTLFVLALLVSGTHTESVHSPQNHWSSFTFVKRRLCRLDQRFDSTKAPWLLQSALLPRPRKSRLGFLPM